MVHILLIWFDPVKLVEIGILISSKIDWLKSECWLDLESRKIHWEFPSHPGEIGMLILAGQNQNSDVIRIDSESIQILISTMTYIWINIKHKVP